MRWLLGLVACLLALSTNAAAEIELGDAKEASPNPAVVKSFEYFEQACLEAYGDPLFIQDFAEKNDWKLKAVAEDAADGTVSWNKYADEGGLFKLYVKPLSKDGRTGFGCTIFSLSATHPNKREKIQAETFEYIRALEAKSYAGFIKTLGSYEVDVDDVNATGSNPLLVHMTPTNRQDIVIGYGLAEGKIAVWHVLAGVPSWWISENE